MLSETRKKVKHKRVKQTVVETFYFFPSLASRNSSAMVRSDESGSSDAAEKIRDTLQVAFSQSPLTRVQS